MKYWRRTELSQLDGRSSLQGIQSGSRILFVQRQLRVNRRQPKQLHLRVQREAFPQVLSQGFGSRCVARHGKGERGFDLYTLTRGNKLQSPCRRLPGLRSIAISGFSLSSNRLPDCALLPCCQRVRRNRLPCWSVPAPCPDDRYMRRCRMPTLGLRVRNRPCPHTTVAVPPSPTNLTRETQVRREHCGVGHHRFFEPAHRG